MAESAHLVVHPLLARMAERPRQTGLAPIEGYVGPSDKGVVRLYRTLAMDAYTDVPADAVVESTTIEGSPDGRVRVFVESSSEVTQVSLRRKRADAVPGPGDEVLEAFADNAPGPGNTDSLRATCRRVGELIEAYEDLLNGKGLLGGAAQIPAVRELIQAKLREARQFKESVCDPVLAT